jgi:DNA transposition AAA+ family ATPase
MTEASNVTPIRGGDAELRDQMHSVLAANPRLTQVAISREIGVSPSAYNQWTKGVYAGDNPGIEAKLRIWLDALAARRAAGARMPAAPEWIPTPTAQRIIGALSYAQGAGDIAVIYGGAGLGKTTAIRHYVSASLNVWHVTMTPASASIVTALEEICATLGLAETGGAAKLFRAVVKRVRGTGGLLVIDEAQHLSVAALDQIRSIHDATELGIALVGNQQVYARLTGGNRAAYLDRLYSRIGKRLSLGQSTDKDIEAVIAAWSIDDTKCRSTLLDIARRPGALRTLTKVLRLASSYAVAEKKPVGCQHISKAWRELGGEA